MFGYIYKVTNVKNSKYYIGKKSGKFDPNYYGSGKLINKAITKYGKENFQLEILEECNNESALNEKEIHYISELKPDYNIAAGGTGGNTLLYASEEYKNKVYEKRSNSLKEKYSSVTPEKRKEWSKSISESKKGKDNGRKGYKHDLKSIEKIKEKNKISASKRDKSWYENHSKAMAERKGQPAHNRKAIVVNGKRYDSIASACVGENTYKQKIYNWIIEGKAYYEENNRNNM